MNNIPENVKEILKQQGITVKAGEYKELNDNNQNLSNIIYCTLLEDDKGRVMVICPRTHIIDLNFFNSQFNRKLTAIEGEKLSKLLENNQLETLPAIPQLFDFPVIIDSQLFKSDEPLWLDSGKKERLISITNDDYKKLSSHYTQSQFSVQVAETAESPETWQQDIFEITQAVNTHTQLAMRAQLEETVDLPPLPQTAQKILKLSSDPNADVNQLVKIVESDPSLAAQVISWAASPYYGVRGEIKNVKDAITRVLGFDFIMSIAVAMCLNKTIELPQDQPRGYTPFWQQASYAAVTAEQMVRKMTGANKLDKGLAYLSGLMHNFGYLVMAYVFPDHFSNICRYMEVNQHINHIEIERYLIGVTRDQVCCWLMHYWDMPEELVVAIRFQHSPNYNGEYSQYALLLYMVQRLLKKQGIGDAPYEQIPDELYQRLNLAPEQVAEVISNVVENHDNVEMLGNSLAA
ncbi:HDOD domain-containing protein [Endozoicomonas sp. SM1973]|uniref:HDOD domain-containing protein n=1 Tax=Spartinivicinus marinus TaxID=2994442 RepID=A0A853IA30_9GAMM|nr:HDOD domain-containing protein [Spartinivicinus marinus]MCX4027163.1 HDOD domain-containing protein [Spartinivicinus marinus]NYZ66115.1 HDOD domain-containing protein [Spartinivicinus marinus]